MKEASGEASMTAITIILVGVIAAVAIPLVRNSMGGVSAKADCVAKGWVWNESTNKCEDPTYSAPTA